MEEMTLDSLFDDRSEERVDEQFCTWFFGYESGADDGPNDALAENFNARPTMSLVREAIQNSLDAAVDDNHPVKVEFSFGSLNVDEIPNLLEVREHIEGCLRLYPDNDNAKEYFPPMLEYLDNLNGTIGYIKVSDENTCGMNYVDEKHTKEPFYAFVRSKGVTAKRSSSSGGSFGFGKAAYFGMSKLKTILISSRTTPEDGSKAFFEGVASLCTHLEYPYDGDDAHKLTAVGYYDNNDGCPIEDEDMIPVGFCREKERPGTDFWIIGYNESERDQIMMDMFQAAIRSFWYTIYCGKLIVKVGDITLNADNIEGATATLFDTNVDKSSSARENYNPRPYLEAVIRGERGGDPRFCCVEKKLPILGNVKLYASLNRDGSNKVLLTRKPKMLVQLRNVSPIGVYAVFTCDDEEGNKLLKRMENPAHTLWLAGRKRDTIDAYHELDNFLTETINNLRPVSGKKSLPVMGLSDLTWIPESLMPEDVEVDEDSQDAGNLRVTEEQQEQENGNQVPVLKKVGTKTKKKDDDQIIERGNQGYVDDDGDSPISAGNTGSGGPGEESGHTPGEGDRGVINSGDFPGKFPGDIPGEGPDGPGESSGSQSVLSSVVKVSLRQYAVMEQGRMMHHLTIYSPKDIDNALMKVFVSIEGGYEEQLVKTATDASGSIAYMADRNKVSGIRLHKGPNKINVRFFDNIKHSIKLTVNESN